MAIEKVGYKPPQNGPQDATAHKLVQESDIKHVVESPGHIKIKNKKRFSGIGCHSNEIEKVIVKGCGRAIF